MNTNETEKVEKAKKAATILSGIFAGWGVPGALAKAIAGAIIGAIAATAALLTSSCTGAIAQRGADGSTFTVSGTVSLPLDAVLEATGVVQPVEASK